MPRKEKTISQFLTNHLFQLMVLIISGIIAFVWLEAEVSNLSIRVEAVEEDHATYPTERWFELKFKTIDEKFIALEKLFKEDK
jgi:hypothetical protein